MAVQDDEQAATVEHATRGAHWREALGHAPAVLLFGGVLMYGFLSICYDRFYRNLGVDPSDVGLSYTGTLARSSGFVVAYLVLAYIVIGIAGQEIRERRTKPGQPLARTSFGFVVSFTVIGLLFVSVIWPPLAAGLSADDVKAGRPIGPVYLPAPVPPLPVLAIHADPATVEPAGKPGDSPAAERLRGRKLFYLGQAGGTLVVYDVAAQQALYVPASSVVLHVANCAARPPPDPSCKQLIRHGDLAG